MENASDALAAADTVFAGIADYGLLNARSATEPGLMGKIGKAVGVQQDEGASVTVEHLLESTKFTDVRTAKLIEEGQKVKDAVNPQAFVKLYEKMGVYVNPNTPEGARQISQLKNMRIPRREAADLKRMISVLKTPQGVGKVLTVVDSVTNLFKSGVTGFWPGFHARNMMSGQLQNAITGQFSFRSIKNGWDLIHGTDISDAHTIPEVARRLAADGVEKPTAADGTDMIRRMLREHEVIHKYEGVAADVGVQAGGVHSQDLNSEFAGGLGGAQPVTFGGAAQKAFLFGQDKPGGPATFRGGGLNANPANQRGVFGRTESTFGPGAAANEVGHLVESMNRIPAFIHNLRKNISASEAADMVKSAQIDYSSKAYSATERQFFARLFPFYKFSSRMAAQTISQLTRTPGGRMAQLVRAGGAPSRIDQAIPDYVAQTMALPLGEQEDGSKRFLTGLGAMHEDPISFLGDGVRGAGLELLSRSNPLIKGPVEWSTGQSFFQRGPLGGRQIEDLDPTMGRTIANLLGQKDAVSTPASLEFIIANSPFARAATSARIATDKRKGILGRAVNLLTGARVTDVSLASMDSIVREQIQRMMKDAKAGSFTRTYFRKADKAKMTPEQLELAEGLEAAMNILAQRAKVRKAEQAKQLAQ